MELLFSEFLGIEFFGVISGTSRYQSNSWITTSQPCAYGWGRYGVYQKGKLSSFGNEIRPRSDSVLELTLDCDHHKIIFLINRSNYGLPMKDIVIDTEACPFPWQWRFRFLANQWAVRLRAE